MKIKKIIALITILIINKDFIALNNNLQNNLKSNKEKYSLLDLPKEILEIILEYTIYNIDNNKKNTDTLFNRNIFYNLSYKNLIKLYKSVYYNIKKIDLDKDSEKLIEFAKNIYKNNQNIKLVCKLFNNISNKNIKKIYNHINKINDNKLLFIAVKIDNKYLFNNLITKENINIQNSNGDSLLMWASIEGHTEMAKKLIKLGADTNIKNNDGDTAIIHASRNNNKDILELLIENNADINSANKKSDTPLIWAARNGFEDIVKILIRNNANINHQNNKGDTALIWAFKNNNLNIAKILQISTNNTINTNTLNQIYEQENQYEQMLEAIIMTFY